MQLKNNLVGLATVVAAPLVSAQTLTPPTRPAGLLPTIVSRISNPVLTAAPVVIGSASVAPISIGNGVVSVGSIGGAGPIVIGPGGLSVGPVSAGPVNAGPVIIGPGGLSVGSVGVGPISAGSIVLGPGSASASTTASVSPSAAPLTGGGGRGGPVIDVGAIESAAENDPRCRVCCLWRRCCCLWRRCCCLWRRCCCFSRCHLGRRGGRRGGCFVRRFPGGPLLFQCHHHHCRRRGSDDRGDGAHHPRLQRCDLQHRQRSLPYPAHRAKLPLHDHADKVSSLFHLIFQKEPETNVPASGRPSSAYLGCSGTRHCARKPDRRAAL
ncbi:hypothetical protein B0H63DRAFT_126593 [Podospora didyma]|uniref:Uncharacterized protein n=1 Tax=Podospora didyma TaxID=330526 RepID=A0AAE0P022_9PEZI|nr:hypothetical protein B0H63DRAFT_126593 [Podospora didyma]